MSISQILKDAYFSQIQYNFKYHPRGEFMVKAILADQLTVQEIAEQLDVAAWYRWQNMIDRIHETKVDQKGFITFKMRR